MAVEALPKSYYAICLPIDFDDGKYVFYFEKKFYEAMAINNDLSWVKKVYWELLERNKRCLIAKVEFWTDKDFRSLNRNDPYQFIKWIKIKSVP